MTLTANNRYVGGEEIALYGFDVGGPSQCLNRQVVTVQNPTATTFQAQIPACSGQGPVTSTNASITSWSSNACPTSQCTVTFNISPALSTAYPKDRPIYLSGFGTTTAFNGQSVIVGASTTTSFAVFLGTTANQTKTETGIASGIGAAALTCHASGQFNPTWLCFSYGKTGSSNIVELSGPGGVVEDSYITNMGGVGSSTFYESQAIHGGGSNGPTRISNNHLEASTETIFFGGTGSPTYNSNVNPSDIEVYNNDLYTPPVVWVAGIANKFLNASGGIAVVRPDGRISAVTDLKDKFECKMCKRAHFYNNIVEGNWPAWYVSYAALDMVPRYAQSQGTANSSIEDVLVENNLWTWINLGALTAPNDSNCGWLNTSGNPVNPACNYGGFQNPTEKRFVFRNNLVLNGLPNNGYLSTVQPGFVNIAAVNTDMSFDHNTYMSMSGMTPATSTNGLFFNGSSVGPANNFWYTNNVNQACPNSNSSIPISAWSPLPNGAGLDATVRFSGNVCTPSNPSLTGWNTTTNSTSTGPAVQTQVAFNCADGSKVNCWSPYGVFAGNYELNNSSLSPGWVDPATETPCGVTGSATNTTDSRTAGVDWPCLSSKIATAITGGSTGGGIITPPAKITTSHVGPSGLGRTQPRPRPKKP